MLGKYALALARRGMAVFPCKPRDKTPLTEHGCRDATVDPALIETWWNKEPNANIGVATGANSHCLSGRCQETRRPASGHRHSKRA
jgi:hypothetical protein